MKKHLALAGPSIRSASFLSVTTKATKIRRMLSPRFLVRPRFLSPWESLTCFLIVSKSLLMMQTARFFLQKHFHQVFLLSNLTKPQRIISTRNSYLLNCVLTLKLNLECRHFYLGKHTNEDRLTYLILGYLKNYVFLREAAGACSNGISQLPVGRVDIDHRDH